MCLSVLLKHSDTRTFEKFWQAFSPLMIIFYLSMLIIGPMYSMYMFQVREQE